MNISSDYFKEKFPLLASEFSQENCNTLLNWFSVFEYPSHTNLFQHGSHQDKLYLILQGVLAISFSINARQVPLGQIGAGQWLGELSVIEPGPATANVNVVEDALVLVITHREFKHLRKTQPELASNILHAVCIELNDRMASVKQSIFKQKTNTTNSTRHSESWLTQTGRRLVGQRTEILNKELKRLVELKQNELEDKFTHLQLQESNRVLKTERERIMRDMHDGVGGQLVSALSIIQNTKTPTTDVAQILRTALDDLRFMIDSFDLEANDLPTILGNVRFRIEQQLVHHGIQLQWKITDVPPIPDMGPSKALQIMRILQEIFTNIIKHAQASTVVLSTCVKSIEANIVIEVKDNGVGIKLDDINKHGSRGLKNMTDRAEKINCCFKINSDHSGTSAKLLIPLK